MKALVEYVLQNSRQATSIALAAVLLSLLGLPFLGAVAAVVLALVTLRHGPREGLKILVWIAIPSIGLMLSHHLGIGLQRFFGGYFLIWLFAAVLCRSVCWQRVLQLTWVLGCLVVLGVHLIVPEVQALWLITLQAFAKSMSLSFPQMKTPLPLDYLQVMASLMTGVVYMISALNALFYLWVARLLQASLYHPGGVSAELSQLSLDKLSSGVLLLVLIGAFTVGGLFLDLLPVVVLPFTLTGLCLVHSFIAPAKQGAKRRLGLFVIFYTVFLLFLFYMAVMLAVIAAIDTWFDLRSGKLRLQF